MTDDPKQQYRDFIDKVQVVIENHLRRVSLHLEAAQLLGNGKGDDYRLVCNIRRPATGEGVQAGQTLQADLSQITATDIDHLAFKITKETVSYFFKAKLV